MIPTIPAPPAPTALDKFNATIAATVTELRAQLTAAREADADHGTLSTMAIQLAALSGQPELVYEKVKDGHRLSSWVDGRGAWENHKTRIVNPRESDLSDEDRVED